MKILATSDLHGRLDGFKKAVAKEKPGIVIVAGDITNKSKVDPDRAAQVWNELFEICKSIACKNMDFVVVPGNHDHGSRTIAKVFALQQENFHYLDRHAKAPTVIKGIRFFGGEKNKPEKLKHVKGKADIVVFHYNPTKGDDRMAVVEGMHPDLIVHGHNHRSSHKDHFDRKQGEMLKINVSTSDKEDYGYYLIDYTVGGAISADWRPVK